MERGRNGWVCTILMMSIRLTQDRHKSRTYAAVKRETMMILITMGAQPNQYMGETVAGEMVAGETVAGEMVTGER